jgi:hypothetical protein
MTEKERGFFYRHEQMMKEKKNKREYDSGWSKSRNTS